jgi:DNA primase
MVPPDPIFDNSAREQVRARIDISEFVGRYVKLKPSGQNFKGLCPFHKEKTPSFVVSPSRGTFHCFGCGKGGDIFSFLQEMEGVEFKEALRMLAEEAGVSLGDVQRRRDTPAEQFPSKSEMLAIHREAAQFYYRRIRESEQAKEYLKSRGLKAETVKEFVLGYAPRSWSALTDHAASHGTPASSLVACGLALRKGNTEEVYDRFRARIIFTLFDMSGRPIGFAARAMEAGAEPKYLNSPETPIYHKSRALYGIHKARASIKERDQLILVEGYMDFLALYQTGVRNVVATSGTALTADHGQIVRRFAKHVVLVFDGDAAGINAAERAVFVLAPYGLDVRVLILPEGDDPDSFVRKHGPKEFEGRVATAGDGFEFVLEKAVREKKGDTPQGQIAVCDHLRPFLEAVGERILVQSCVKKTAERLGISDALAYSRLNLPSPGRAAVVRHGADAGRQQYGGTLEGNFMRILLNNPGLVGRAKEWVKPETVTDGFTSDLYSILLATAEEDPGLASLIDRIDDPETKRVVSTLVVHDGPTGRVEDELVHTALRLQAKYLKTKMREVKGRLKREPQNKRQLLVQLKDLSSRLLELDTPE